MDHERFQVPTEGRLGQRGCSDPCRDLCRGIRRRSKRRRRQLISAEVQADRVVAIGGAGVDVDVAGALGDRVGHRYDIGVDPRSTDLAIRVFVVELRHD